MRYQHWHDTHQFQFEGHYYWLNICTMLDIQILWCVAYWALSQYKDCLNGKGIAIIETVSQPSNLYNGNSLTWKNRRYIEAGLVLQPWDPPQYNDVMVQPAVVMKNDRLIAQPLVAWFCSRVFLYLCRHQAVTLLRHISWDFKQTKSSHERLCFLVSRGLQLVLRLWKLRFPSVWRASFYLFYRSVLGPW